MRRTTCILPFFVLLAAASAGDLRLIRSLSGPSGHVSGSKFIFDEMRSRFVYPQDKTLTVYFEWGAPPGLHVLSASWRQPDGRIATISSDVKIETQSPELNCYWVFTLTPDLPNGVWTVEVRIDGQPAGSHPFEIAGTEPARTAVTEPPPEPKQPTLDQIYKAVSPSVVWIYKLDQESRRVDTSSGFVYGAGRVLTAFQAVDSASQLEAEFASGRKVRVDSVVGCSRVGDWAMLSVDTASVAPIPRGDPEKVEVGGRLIVFNVDAGARVIGGVDIAGRRAVKDFGPRIQISPSVAPEAAGGPLLDLFGRAVAILGGSVTPGARFEGRVMNVSAGLFNSFSAENAATPLMPVFDRLEGDGKTLDALAKDGTLTIPIVAQPEFMYGATTADLPRRASDPLPKEISDFSARDPQICVSTMWIRKGKRSKGMMSARVYDAMNRLRVNVEPKKVTMGEIPMRVAFTFAPTSLAPGVYRVDVNWDDQPAWRTFFRITD